MSSAATKLHWPPRNRRELIEHARLSYEAHCEVMAEAYPPFTPKPWDDQDAAVREAWIEQITPELGSGATDAKSAARDEPAHGFPDVGSRDAPHTDLDLIVLAVRRAYAARSNVGAVTRWLELALEVAEGNREDYPNEIGRLLGGESD